MKNIVRILVIAAATLMASSAFAQETASAGLSASALTNFAAFLGLAIAAVGGAIGQSRVAAELLKVLLVTHKQIRRSLRHLSWLWRSSKQS